MSDYQRFRLFATGESAAELLREVRAPCVNAGRILTMLFRLKSDHLRLC
jgi:hypothetical protein